jgi:aminotransferase
MSSTVHTASRLHLSHLSPEVVQSDIRAMSVECDAVHGINLAQGICDTPIPAVVLDAAHQAIAEGRNTYSRLDGITPLRAALARKFSEYNNLDYDPAREILVTSGATGAFDAAVKALLNPGDEVLLFEPFYGYHLNTLLAVRAVPVAVPLSGDDFDLDRDALVAAITPRTRAVLINTPSNPAGKVFSRPELEFIAALATEHDLFVFTDEIYEYFLYDGIKHISPASLPGMRERTITISGFSKVFSVTGWRVGYLAADARWTPSMGYFQDLTYICAPTPFQFACTAGLDQLGSEYYTQLAADYHHKRDQTLTALRAAGLKPSVPRGAYYILADVSSLPGRTAKEKAMFLLQKTGVAAVPGGSFFTKDGPNARRAQNMLRFCFAKTPADLNRACEALANLRL